MRDFITDSAATIRVQSLAELTPSDPERTISVSGARDKVLRAVALILNTVSAWGSSLRIRRPGRPNGGSALHASPRPRRRARAVLAQEPGPPSPSVAL